MEPTSAMASPTLPSTTLPGDFNPKDQENIRQVADVEEPVELLQPTLPEEDHQTAKFEFRWQDLPSVAKYINHDQWYRSEPSAVLQTLPKNLVVAELLTQILQWSLQRTNPSNKTDPKASDILPAQLVEVLEDGNDSDSIQEERMDLPLTPSTLDENDHQTTPVSTDKRITQNLLTRLRRLRQDVALKRAASVRQKEKMIANNIPSPEEQIPETSECISCFEDLPTTELTHLECSHDYCKICLHEVVINAMKTESAFPPKCCLSEIPRKQILSCLDNEERDGYKNKSAEYSIPAGHRWYCPEPKCAKWIRPEKLHKDRRTHQVCPHCCINICSICRSVAHPEAEDCPQDFGLESTLEIADSEGWRRCYSCRTMVELTRGCIHITCVCKAEFCYVCNARWRTCNCTEADKERRLAELRNQREQRTREQEEADAAAEAEAEEVAEAIRQVEEMELEEMARREEQERQRQLEEDLALARLEEERLLEEIARREAELEQERQLQAILMASSKEECQTMMSTLMQIINFQHAALMSEHACKESEIKDKKEKDQERHSAKAATHTRWLKNNIKRRRQDLKEKHVQEQQALQSQAEEEEDDMFMQMQIYLKDKPNREAREKKMRDSLQKKQSEQTQDLSKNHEEERQKLDNGVLYEREGLRKALYTRLDPIVKEFQSSLRTLGKQIGDDREWFQHVSTRRIEMILEHRRIVISQLEAHEDPAGLTEETAAFIKPIPILEADDGGHPESQRPESSSSTRLPLNIQIPQSSENTERPSNNGIATASVTTIRNKDTTPDLNRSDTVVRSIPGAYPPSQPTIKSNRVIVPAARPPQRQRITSELLSGNGATPISPSLPTALPANRTPLSDSFSEQQTSKTSNSSNPWQSTLRTPPDLPDGPFQQPDSSPTLSQDFSSGASSTRPSTILSQTSISPLSSKRSSAVTDNDILSSVAAGVVTNGERQVKKGLFTSNRFGRRLHMNE